MEDLDKLKKKIDQLEDDIEDLEGDLDNEQKKRREAESAKSELEGMLSEKDKVIEDAKQNLSFAEKQLSKSQKEVDTIAKSMHFVSEILNAKSENDNEQSDFAKLFRIVDDIVSFVIDYVDFTKRVFNFDPLHLTDKETNEEIDVSIELYTWAFQTKKPWLRGKKSIAFVGEFSAGKTSIVNRLLGQNVNDKNDKGLLYTSAKAATAVPTYVIGGDKERFNFVTKDDELKILSKETFTSASKEVMDKIEGLPNLVKYFIMYQRLPALDRFSILDTPGFNSNDSADANRTMEVINECDALFWVIDVNAGTVNKSSLKVIKEGYSSFKPLYVVINKTDTKSSGEVSAVVSKVQGDFNRAGISVTGIICFGFKSDLATLINPIAAIEKKDDFDWILDYVDKDVKDSVKVLQQKYKEVDKESRDWSEEVAETIKILENNFGVITSDAEEVHGAICDSKRNLSFTGDYKISPAQGEYLIETVENLSDVVELQKRNIGIFKDHVEANQKAEQEFQNIKSDLKDAKALQERFKKLLGEYKKCANLVAPPNFEKNEVENYQKQNGSGYVTSTTENQSQVYTATSTSSPRDTPNVNNEVEKEVREPQAQTVVFSNITLKRDYSSQEWRLTVSDAHLMTTSFNSPKGGAFFMFKCYGDRLKNMGGTGFPSGVAEVNGPSIYVSEGYWSVTFNVVDGSYAFTKK